MVYPFEFSSTPVYTVLLSHRKRSFKKEQALEHSTHLPEGRMSRHIEWPSLQGGTLYIAAVDRSTNGILVENWQGQMHEFGACVATALLWEYDNSGIWIRCIMNPISSRSISSAIDYGYPAYQRLQWGYVKKRSFLYLCIFLRGSKTGYVLFSPLAKFKRQILNYFLPLNSCIRRRFWIHCRSVRESSVLVQLRGTRKWRRHGWSCAGKMI